MYCENCQLEIKEQEEKQCPLCGGPLSESSAAGSLSDKADGIDFESLLQDDAPPFVLDDDDESGGLEADGPAAPELDSTERKTGGQRPGAADAGLTSGAMVFSDDSSADMLDQVLQEYDPLVDEHFKVKKSGSNSTTAMLLIVLLVCALGGGLYYYFMMRDQDAPAPVVPAHIAVSQKQNTVLDKVLRKEPLSAQHVADNATQAAKKPDEPAQIAGNKIDAPVAAGQQLAAVQSVEPPVPSKISEKAALQDASQPQADIKKEEIAPSSAPAQRLAPAAGAPAAEEAKKTIKPAAAPVANPPAAAVGKPVFSVLTGSFRSQSNAEAEVNRLRKLGFEARMIKVALKGKGQWHRVLIGSWTRQAEALQAVKEVRRKTGKNDASIISSK